MTSNVDYLDVNPAFPMILRRLISSMWWVSFCEIEYGLFKDG